MILKAYALFDEKAGAFALPFFCQNHSIAIRMVQEVGMDLNTTVGRHPNDFILYHVGEWDDQVGQFIAFPVVGLGLVGALIAQERGALGVASRAADLFTAPNGVEGGVS